MHIAILTFEGFNEFDSLIAFGILNRVRKPGWRVTLSCPAPAVTSMNGVIVQAQSTLEEACAAEAVIVGSGKNTREIAGTPALMQRLKLDPSRQLIGAQCSGTLVLAKLGILAGVPVCTDLSTRPWVEDAGVEVLNQPFFARGSVATAGGSPRVAVPRRVDPRSDRGRGSRAKRPALRGPGRREGRVRRAGHAADRAVPAVDLQSCGRIVECPNSAGSSES